MTTEGIDVVFEDGVALVEMKMPGRANKIGKPFVAALDAALDKALSNEECAGIILTSGHKDFCVGADIDMLFGLDDAADLFDRLMEGHQRLRRMEKCGKPIVAALNGSALGGGYELALACHHRIVIKSPKIMVGLPEAMLGLIPGAGGTQRLPYLLGLQASIEHMAAGTPVRGHKALAKGMVDAYAEDRDDLIAKAKAWIAENPKPVQPWDQKRWKWPGGARPGTPDAKMLFVGATAFTFKKTAGAFAAPDAIIRAVADGTQLAFDRGLEIESRFFTKLALSNQAKDMIRTLWFHRTAAEKLGVGMEHGFKKVTILGAGMMGAGLGFLSAKAGLDVVLKDIKQEALDGGKAHCETEINKLKHFSQEKRDAILSRITFTLENEPIRGSDLIIEAVVENVGIKHAVTQELEPLLAENGVWASNTSAIPITRLGEVSKQKDRFIGLHFFSPVEKMPLLEVIQPDACSDDTLNRCLAFGKAIGRTNIVVGDGYGFYTSRLFASYILEGVQLVAEGHDAVLVEWAARTASMVMPPLKVFDEVSLTLGRHAFETRKEVTGDVLDLGGIDLVAELVEIGRYGKAHGQGFYDWETRTIWPGLADMTPDTPEVTGLDYIQSRLMLAQAAEMGRVLEDGIIRDHKDAEVGAILGLGFAPGSGGPLSWIDRQGLRNVVGQLRDLAKSVGERYEPAPILVEMAEKNQTFWGDWTAAEEA
jgi:3-hydroxyacyl-CoA dehydrogenase / enoyl-CoA hydratase / 3-hydroxybutyryl-CoA epimerase